MTRRPRRALVLAVAAGLALGGCLQAASLPRGPTPTDPPPLPPRRPAPPVDFAAAAALPIPAGLYRVEAGDTVYSIAQRAGLPLRALIDANGLQPPYTLVVGRNLIVPRARVHVVKAGETVYGISRLHGVDTSELTRLNGIGPPFEIRVGQRLVLPDLGRLQVATAPADPNLPAASTATSETPRGEPGLPAAAPSSTGGPPVPPRRPETSRDTASTAAVAPTTAPSGPSVPASSAALPQPPPRAGDAFVWPVRGRILARYGPQAGGRHNDGINIAAPRGAPFLAAENGVVAYVGSELKGFGNLVLVKHADGWVTAYAHADAVTVRLGETVRRGQPIGRVGDSGAVDQPQLHFEVRKGTNAVDPLQMLERSS